MDEAGRELMDESVLCWDNMMKTMSQHTKKEVSISGPSHSPLHTGMHSFLPTGDGIMIH